MKRIKKFYDTVSIEPVLNAKSSPFKLLLDGKQVRTPLGEHFHLRNEAIAAAVATEWQLQTNFVVPNSMPLSTVLMTNMDIDSKLKRTEHLSQIYKYFQTDSLRFPELDIKSKLGTMQVERWDPVFTFLKARNVPFTQSKAGFLLPESTESEIHTIDEVIMPSYDSLGLTIIETASKYLKSASIALALVEGVLSPTEAFEAAFVEEIYQRSEWGLVEGDHDINDAETHLWLHGIRLLCTSLKS